MKIKPFKCRASKIGLLMTNHTGKSYREQYDDALLKRESFQKRLAEFKNQHCKSAIEIEYKKLPEIEKEIERLKPLIDEVILSETAKSYCKEWLISEITGKKKDIRSKYLARGKAMEEKAIERISKHYGLELVKNEEPLENEYFTGTYDTNTPEIVIDAKVPFDCFTFPYFETEPDKNYYGQIQVYQELKELRKGSLCYCLENGSEEQINKLSWDLARDLGKDEPDIEDWDIAVEMLSYDNLPDSLRKKVFEFCYDEAYIKKAEKMVLASRKYIENELIPMLKL
jgi:hypothetical protein